jgi:hypothetical protein
MVNPPVGRKGERSLRYKSGSVSLSSTSLLDVPLALCERPESASRGKGDVTWRQRPSASAKARPAASDSCWRLLMMMMMMMMVMGMGMGMVILRIDSDADL